MSNFAGIKSSDGTLNVFVGGKPYTVAQDHPNYQELIEAWNCQDSEAFLQLVDIEQNVRDFVSDSTLTEVKNGQVLYRGEPVHNVLTNRIMELMEQGYDFRPMVRFLENLMENPSSRAVQELYPFLDRKHLPITNDGCFLAYKSVRSDYRDKYSGRFDNSVGKVVSVPRQKVDDDFRHECSHGLHVGALEYSGPDGWYHNPGDRVVVVKVNPKDVVSVPLGHDATKCRVCKYEIVDEYKDAFKEPVVDRYDNEDENYDWDDNLLKGDNISFTYNLEDRFGTVHEVRSDVVILKMFGPDKSSGEFRSFLRDNMTDISLY